MNTLSLVNEAIKLRDEDEYDKFGVYLIRMIFLSINSKRYSLYSR